MKNNILLFFGILLLVSCQKNGIHSFNPGKAWLANDSLNINAHGGGVLFYDGKYYLFGQFMVEGDAGNRAQVGVSCYSSKDLYNWKNEGIALKVSDDTTSDIRKDCVLERPKVIYNAKTKKFVMWFHLEMKSKGYSAARSGVAIADNITGPYTYLHSERPDAGFWPVNITEAQKTTNNKCEGVIFTGGSAPAHPDSLNILGRDFKGGQMARDMNLFVDDDGKAYHIFSSEENSTLHISQLSDDYLSHSGKYARAFVGRFMEGAAMFKCCGKYYLVASSCTGWAPNAARSAVADSIFGPWKEMGNPCVDADSALTYHSQSTFVLPVQGKEHAFIFMADRWTPENAINCKHVWLPIDFEKGRFILHWLPEWDLSYFDKK
jgi:beta-xylosidase